MTGSSRDGDSCGLYCAGLSGDDSRAGVQRESAGEDSAGDRPGDTDIGAVGDRCGRNRGIV